VSLSTHVLDADVGGPAAGVAVRLERRKDAGWLPVAAGHTGDDGRLADWLPEGELGSGVYRLVFDTGGYFAGQRRPTFYPEVAVSFEVGDPGEHYHVPLLLNAFGYTTYRGA
jgi:5-hydroxyisourate hydrolase